MTYSIDTNEIRHNLEKVFNLNGIICGTDTDITYDEGNDDDQPDVGIDLDELPPGTTIDLD